MARTIIAVFLFPSAILSPLAVDSPVSNLDNEMAPDARKQKQFPTFTSDTTTYSGYPFATVSVFLARSSTRQQYQLATEANGRQGIAIVKLVFLSGKSSSR